ncbi:MAG: type II secretion system protein [Gammaproteobacteria bacterium]|nr:type II secretion system protein [Gammaproteobacteria bacterium]
MNRYHNGFTLVEMAIVLVIISLLLGGLLVPLSTQIEVGQREAAERAMAEIREALTGYAAVNGYLPCPDSDNPPDGRENRAGKICTGASTGGEPNTIWHGVIPWVDLGVEDADPWAIRYRYLVMETFSDREALFTLATSGNIRVQDGAGNDIISDAPAIIVSHGKNRFNGIDLAGNNQPNSPSNDEVENADQDRDFITRTYSTAVGTQFDDLVVWVSPNILFNRMVAARRLP